MTEERLQAFAVAWARHDVELLMTFLMEDCTYEASVGPEPGKTYVGQEAAQQGLIDMLAHDAQGESRSGPMFLFGDKGMAEWSYVWAEPDGRVIELREFRGDKISRKNAFRKTFQQGGRSYASTRPRV